MLFGHSYGAWLVYELAQQMRPRSTSHECSFPQPVCLMVSGNRAPHLYGTENDVDPTVLHKLQGGDFWVGDMGW